MGYIQNRYGENIAQNYAIQPDPWYGKVRSARSPQINRYRPPSSGTFQKFGAPASGPMIDARGATGTFGGLVRGLQGAYKSVQDQRVADLEEAINAKANKTTTARKETNQFIKTHKATKRASEIKESIRRGKLDEKLGSIDDSFSRPKPSSMGTPTDRHGTLDGEPLKPLGDFREKSKDLFGRPILKDTFGSLGAEAVTKARETMAGSKFMEDVASAPADRETSPLISEGFGTRVKPPTTVENTPAEEATARWLRGDTSSPATAPSGSRNMIRSNPFPKGPIQP